MTNEDAIKYIKARCIGSAEERDGTQWSDAMWTAIEALQNLSKPNNGLQSSNLVSRSRAIEGIREYIDEYKYNDIKWSAMKEAEMLIESLPSADRSTGWIPFKKRPLTDEEKEEYPDWIYIFDCPLPDDGQEILLSNGKYVWTDTFFNDGECYLDGGDDIDDGMAWMPLPEPWKDGE